MIDQERTQRNNEGGGNHSGPPLDLFILAFLFTVMFLVTIVYAFSNVTDDATWTNTRDLLEILLPTVVALVGTVVAFYFGARQR